jgi:hypothetical protein
MNPKSLPRRNPAGLTLEETNPMKTLITLSMVAILSMPVAATDVSGTWDLTMHWPGDRQSTGVCTFKQDGHKLSGTCGGADRFPIQGEVNDQRLTWQFHVAQDGNKGEMAFAGELDGAGTAIKGSCRIVGAQEGTFTMVKQPPK